MFYKGEAVRSCHHGLGLVAESGRDPVVAFLNGPRRREEGTTLTIVPGALYDAEYLNRDAIERWLDLRLYGDLRSRNRLLPRTPCELENLMRSATPTLTIEGDCGGGI